MKENELHDPKNKLQNIEQDKYHSQHDNRQDTFRPPQASRQLYSSSTPTLKRPQRTINKIFNIGLQIIFQG